MPTYSWECWKRTCSLLHLRVRHLCFTSGSFMMCLAFGFSKRRPCWHFSHMQTRLIRVSTSRTVLVQKWTSWIHLCRLEVTLFLRTCTRSPPILTSICCLPVTTLHIHLPYGLGIHLSAIVSDDTRLEHRLSELTAFMTARGYSKPAVEEQPDRVRTTPGDHALNCTKRRLGTNRTALVCTWNTRLPVFSELLRDSFPILQSNEHLRSVFDFPLVSYRRPRNIRDFVSPSTEQSRKARTPQPDGTFPCDRPRCKTCERVHSIATLPYGADRSISIPGHHSCQSALVVYLISCTQAQCDAVYIGDTGCTLRERG